MAYVITGATGHIGNNLVRMLVEEKEEVKVIVRKMDKSLEGLNIKVLLGDLFDEAFLTSSINQGDILIHLVGLIDIKNKKKEESLKVNYELTKLMYKVASKKGVKHFIYCSSVDAIYKDDLNEFDKILEPVILYPEKFKDNYPKTKAMATNFVIEKMKENHDFNISIVYPSAVIGINDYKPSLIGKVVKDCLSGKTEFGIDGGYNFIDVIDVAKAIISVSKTNVSDTYILSGFDISVSELYSIINEKIGKKKKIIKIPYFLVLLSIPFVPYLSKFSLKTLREKHNYDATKAKEKLGLTLTPFDKTIEDVVNFFKKVNE